MMCSTSAAARSASASPSARICARECYPCRSCWGCMSCRNCGTSLRTEGMAARPRSKAPCGWCGIPRFSSGRARWPPSRRRSHAIISGNWRHRFIATASDCCSTSNAIGPLERVLTDHPPNWQGVIQMRFTTLTLMALVGGLLSFLTRTPSALAAANPPLVVTQSGPVAGLTVGSVNEYLGIPYAAPLVGYLAGVSSRQRLSAVRFPDRTGCRQRELPVPQRLYAGFGGFRSGAAGDGVDSRWWPDRRQRRALRSDAAGGAGQRDRRNDQLPPGAARILRP